MPTSKLHELLRNFDAWARTAARDHDGWETSFPGWDDLIASAAASMLALERGEDVDTAAIARGWSRSEETEDLIGEVTAHPNRYGEGLKRIFRCGDCKARWQVVSIADRVEGLGREMIMEGLADAHHYVRRRAFLALVDLDLQLARQAAKSLMDDPDEITRGLASEIIERVE